MGPDPAQRDMIEAAFAQAYADSDERQRWGMANAGYGVAAGWEPKPDASGLPPRGLGYEHGPDPVPVFAGPEPGLVPVVLEVPEPLDLAAGPALTGVSHDSWGSRRQAGPGLVYAGLADDPAPRRSLLNRRLRRR